MPRRRSGEGTAFGAGCLAFLALAAWLAAIWPIQLSLAAVFLFAGPHNVAEARYLMTRLPARWGRTAPYFATGIVGVATLALFYLALVWAATFAPASPRDLRPAFGLWCVLVALWIVALVEIRRRQPPRRRWPFFAPAALTAADVAALAPEAALLGLVYLHPLLGLWLLDRELGRSRPGWRAAFRRTLLALPAAIACLAWHGGSLPSHPLVEPLTRQAGASLLPWASSHSLVAVHALLELLHYGVWLLAIPLASDKVWNGDWSSVPWARRPGPGRRIAATLLLAGAAGVVVLWFAFSIDYAATREVYFALAIFHVLAEFPLLIRSL